MPRNTPENPLCFEKEMDGQWLEVEAELELGKTELLAQNPLDRARRTYKKREDIYKIVLLQYEITSNIRNCSMAEEFKILKQCRLKEVPEVLRYDKKSNYEYIVFKYIAGTSLSETKLQFVSFVSLLFTLSRVIFQLARAGISHNDIKEENIMVAEGNTFFLIDFDQATQSNFWTALITNLTGMHLGRKNMSYGSLARVIKEQLRKILTPKQRTIIKKMLGRYDKTHTLPVLPKDANQQLRTLLEAWKLAQLSGASSPGEFKAYYSLELGEYYFPGERPWINRWNTLQGITVFSGKRILELGCNMGLLSTFLLKEKHAAEAMAIDTDKDILKSAEKIASTFDVQIDFQQVDFDSSEDWETDLSSFQPDIVFALNVLNWVQDKNRLMNFLGRFPEVIFEGHDDVETESKRFQDVGFDTIELISVTERNRPLLHCTKKR